MTDSSHPEQCQCGGPSCTKAANLGASHIAPESIDLPPAMAEEVEALAHTCREAQQDGVFFTCGMEGSAIEKVLIESPGESPPHESVWAYRMSDDTAKLLNKPYTWRFDYGEVVRLTDQDDPDKLPLVAEAVRMFHYQNDEESA